MTKVNNLAGQKFNMLLVLNREPNNEKGNAFWLCRCDCGNTTILPSYRLTGGVAKSCGCLLRKSKISTGDVFHSLTVKERCGTTEDGNPKWLCVCACGGSVVTSSSSLLKGKIQTCGHWKASIEAGDRFGRLTVVEEAGRYRGRERQWNCQCECGKYTIVNQTSLISTRTRSCGCLNIDSHTTHGLSKTKEYSQAVNHARREKQRSVDIEDRTLFIRAVRAYFGKCVTCGISSADHRVQHNQALHVDHILPITKQDGTIGEGLYPGNAVTLCVKCNGAKSNRRLDQLPTEWRNKILSAAEEFKIAWESGFRA